MSSQHKNKKESNNKIKKKPSKIFDMMILVKIILK
jgi:hypothetical protein